ncbi:Uncharacterised protein [Peptoniphilus lacrimalis]|uniref:Uncharacterized protein n=1 Tax=Peptoniphilus lacrimalis TaxID=33031 RepID=A0A379C2G4_9FIRM|nr:Uncharacterised protein [Peptoniphilus lacrimalis]
MKKFSKIISYSFITFLYLISDLILNRFSIYFKKSFDHKFFISSLLVQAFQIILLGYFLNLFAVDIKNLSKKTLIFTFLTAFILLAIISLSQNIDHVYKILFLLLILMGQILAEFLRKIKK